MEFPSLFTGATIYKLEENYRSTQPILNLANTIIEAATEKYSKHLFTRKLDGPCRFWWRRQGRMPSRASLREKILELREKGFHSIEIAVLFRSSFHSFDLEIELSRHGLPFVKRGGVKLYRDRTRQGSAGPLARSGQSYGCRQFGIGCSCLSKVWDKEGAGRHGRAREIGQSLSRSPGDAGAIGERAQRSRTDARRSCRSRRISAS